MADEHQMSILIKKARKAKGLSQADVARLLSVSNQAVSRWEQGREPIPEERLQQLSDLLDLEIPKIQQVGMTSLQRRVLIGITEELGYEGSLKRLSGNTVDKGAAEQAALIAQLDLFNYVITELANAHQKIMGSIPIGEELHEDSIAHMEGEIEGCLDGLKQAFTSSRAKIQDRVVYTISNPDWWKPFTILQQPESNKEKKSP